MMHRRNLLAAGLAGGFSALLNDATAAPTPDGAPRQAGEDAPFPPPPFRLGLVSYNVAKDWDLPRVVQNCAAAGIDSFEPRTTHAHGIEPSLPIEQRRVIRKRFTDAGIILWGLGTTCEFHSPDPAEVRKNVEECRAFIDLARDLGCRGVKVRPNGLPAGVSVERTLEGIGAALRECGEAGADQGVEIWVEVHGAGTQNPKMMKRIMDLCGHENVGICWNSNPTDIEGGSVRNAFELLRPRLKSCHINALWSDYPYRELFRLLTRSGYDRHTLCEVGSPIHSDSGAPFLQCYRALWRELASGQDRPRSRLRS